MTSETGSVRPFGITVVAIVEIVVAIVGPVFDLLYWCGQQLLAASGGESMTRPMTRGGPVDRSADRSEVTAPAPLP